MYTNISTLCLDHSEQVDVRTFLNLPLRMRPPLLMVNELEKRNKTEISTLLWSNLCRNSYFLVNRAFSKRVS
jgi:hypothetical protein